MLAAQPRELRATFGPKKPRNAGLRDVSDMCVSAARRLVRGPNFLLLFPAALQSLCESNADLMSGKRLPNQTSIGSDRPGYSALSGGPAPAA